MRDPYDRLLNGMLSFHNHFRQTHAQLMKIVPHSQTASRSTLETTIQHSLSLCRHLEGHHKIEEMYIFPLLATRLPEFGTENPVHIKEHQAMHKKLEVLEHYSVQLMNKLKMQEARKLEADGVGKVIKGGGEGEDDETKVKPWPLSFYDATQFETILRDLASVLFPHLDAEEKSLRASNLKAHGMTLEDLNRIPM